MQSKIKVFQIARGSEVSGICLTSGLLHKHLTDRGYDSRIYCTPDVCSPGTEPRCKAMYNSNTIPLKFLSRPINPLGDILALIELYYIFIKEKPEVIITRTSKGGVIGRVAGKLARVPVKIHYIHGFAFHERTPYPTLKFYSYLEKLSAFLCDQMISVNNEDRLTAIKLGICPPKKIVTIYNGSEFQRFQLTIDKVDLRRILGIPEKAKVVTFASRIVKQKDPFTFIEAIAQLKTTYPELIGLIAGTGPQLKELDTFIKNKGLQSSIRLLGHRNDIPIILKASDIFAALTFYEGLPKNVLEAMAAGLPIVASDVKGNRELIIDGRNGLLVPIQDATATAHAFARLLKDPSLALTFGNHNREKVRNEFDAEDMIKSIISIIEEHLVSKRSARANQ